MTDVLTIPQTKIGKLRAVLLDLLREHEADGALPTSARFLFYELVQRGQLSKETPPRTDGKKGRRPDQDLHDALTDLREDGDVPWDWIADETRSVEHYSGFPTIRDGALCYLNSIRLDPWKGRPPLILTESRSLAGVLRPVARDYACRIASTNGQCGGFLRTDIAPLLRPGDSVRYLGDWDVSGHHIEDNTRRVLERAIGGELDWQRAALTERQVQRYRLPKIIKRDKRYEDERPHEAVETEALKQTTLITILRNHLDVMLPEALDRVLERETRQRRRVAALLRRGRR